MTKRTNLPSACIVALPLIFASACVSVGATSNTAAIALHSSAIIDEIDGKGSWAKSMFHKELKLAAGRHALIVKYIGPEKRDRRTCKIEFEAVAGNRYIVVPHITGGVWAASLRVVETSQTTKHATDRRMDPMIDVPCVF